MTIISPIYPYIIVHLTQTFKGCLLTTKSVIYVLLHSVPLLLCRTTTIITVYAAYIFLLE